MHVLFNPFMIIPVMTPISYFSFKLPQIKFEMDKYGVELMKLKIFSDLKKMNDG